MPYTSNSMDHLTMQHAPPCVSLPVNLVANLQDALLMAVTDLQRLEGLLDHATGNLLDRFNQAMQVAEGLLWARMPMPMGLRYSVDPYKSSLSRT